MLYYPVTVTNRRPRKWCLSRVCEANIASDQRQCNYELRRNFLGLMGLSSL